jgi:nucleotidyltransferase substrate binding protein (TIGR01987 family)
MALEIAPLANAIARLQEGLETLARDPDNTLLRDGVIQRFEFTYETAHKMLKRALQAASPSPAIYDQMSFADLIRSGNEQGLLLSDWPVWKGFRDMRNKSSHSYDEGLAREVAAGIAGFLPDAVFLRNQIIARRL